MFLHASPVVASLAFIVRRHLARVDRSAMTDAIHPRFISIAARNYGLCHLTFIS
jgi:hypothetical protein